MSTVSRGGVSAGLLHGLRALLWLEGRQLVNRVRTVVAHPWRMLAWLVFIAYLLIAVRFRGDTRRSVRTLPTPYGLGDFLAALTPGLALLLIGAVVMMSSSRPPAVFASPADGRFLTSSSMPARLVVAWLQLRQLANYGLRGLLPLALYVTVVPAIFRLGAVSTVLVVVSGALLVAMAMSLRLPVYMHERGHARLPMEAVGAALAALGLAAVSIETAAFASGDGRASGGIEGLMAALPPGAWVVGAGRGDVWSLVLLGLSTLAAMLLTVRVSSDCYPELWDASRRRFALRGVAGLGGPGAGSARRRVLRAAGIAGGVTSVHASVSARLVPGGAGVVLWKEWVSMLRGPGGRPLLLARLLGPGIAGVGVAVLDRGTSSTLATGLGVLVISQVILFNMVSSVQLAPDLRTPMWWSVESSLANRLLAWTVASSLRQSVPVAIGVGTEVAVNGPPQLLLPAVAVILVSCWALRCMAVAVYSLLPARADLRGPVGLLRGLAFTLLVGPVLATGLAVGVATRSALFVTLVVVALLGAEARGMLALATWRISGDALIIARMDEH